MNRKDRISVIEVSVDLSDTWDHCTFREMAGEGTYVDSPSTPGLDAGPAPRWAD